MKNATIRLAILGILALALAMASSPLLAQSTSLSGSVSDPQGALIPGATVTLTNNSTSATRQQITDDRGRYSFVQVAPGKYRMSVEMTGFKTGVRENIELLVATPTTENIVLQLGEISETMTITSEAAQLNTTDASVGNAFNEMKVRELPLLTRNVVELLSLQPGVNQQETGSDADGGGQVAGGRNDQNNVILDGVDVNDQQTPGPFESVLPIPLDSVQEFRVTTVGQNANLGRSGGGQVSLVSKGGTNDWHGSLYEFHRNTVTAANTFFNNANGVERAALIRNQYGFSVGGPMAANRAFFFLNFEQRRDASAANQSRTIPSEAMRNGILTFRTNKGDIQTLSLAEIAAVDPLGIGVSPAILQRFTAYPVGNDADLGLDRGLNFTGFRFNAPQQIDRKAYVAKFDFNLTENGNHTVSWRGTLADNSDDDGANLAQFPGQDPAKSIDNSRGFATNYTAIFKSNLVNTFTWGFTRQGIERSGSFNSQELDIRSISEPLNIAAASFGRKVPAHNFSNNLSWIRGNHTFDGGINFRRIRNDRFDFSNSFAIFNINNGAFVGLGSNILPSINAFIQARSGDPTLALSSGSRTPVVRAMMSMLGTIADVSATFQFAKDGSVIPQGVAQEREFGVNEYEFYFQDSWKVRRDLTLTLGLRYTNATVPWEVNGVQVGTNQGLSDFFNERIGLGEAGIPSNSSNLLSYDLIGAANNRPGYFERDKNNWAPRFALAWNPDFGGGALGRFFGFDGNAVIRLGAGVVYDRFGSQMIVNFDGIGSVGLATNQGFPTTFDYDDAPRFNGSFPALPAPPPGGFPNTPPVNFAVLNSTFGIAEDLRTPYSYLFNLNYQRELPGDLVVDFGYVGRLGRKVLNQLDVATPLNNLIDPASGMTWAQAVGIMRTLRDGGLTLGAIQGNPNLIAPIAYMENMFPNAANAFIPGSATANVYWLIQAFGGASELDALHVLDVETPLSNAFHTFFEKQTSARPTWFNAGNSLYNAFTISLRKRFTRGLSFDFNYTYSHSIDNGSAPESGSGQFGGIIIDAFNIDASRGNSDFDIRHQINTNFLYELPFGHGKALGSGVPGWANQFIGGWQVSGIVRYRTGLPSGVGTGFNFATNYFITGQGVPIRPISTEVGTNSDGVPGLFADKDAAVSAFREQRTGETGPRNILRLDDFVNTDIAVSKSFRMPWEGHRLQFRWELFNAFNNVNFRSVSLSPFQAPQQFGEFSATTDPRVMQFGLRYDF